MEAAARAATEEGLYPQSQRCTSRSSGYDSGLTALPDAWQSADTSAGGWHVRHARRSRRVATVGVGLVAACGLAGCGDVARRAASHDAAAGASAVVATIALPDYGTDVAASADGRVYVTMSTGRLVIVDPKTATISAKVDIQGQPYAVAVTPGGRRAYVVDFLGQYVTVVTTADATVKTTIPIGTIQRPSLRPSAAASRDGRRVYVGDTADDHLLVIQTDADQVTKDMFLDIHPAGIDVSPDGRFVYVAGCRLVCTDGTLLEIDTGTYAITRRIALDASPNGIVLTPDGRRAYLANGADASVSSVDLATLRVTKSPSARSRSGSRWIATGPAST